MHANERRRSATPGRSCGLILAAFLLAAGAPSTAEAVDAPPGPLSTSAGADAAACKGGTASLTSLAMATTTTCEDCDSNEGYCTPGDNRCRNYCLNLVGLEGICHQSCNCCV
jgi:hypothetical protein